MASPNKKTTKIGHQRGVKSTKATNKPQILVDAEAKTDVVEFLNMFHIIGVESDRSWYTKTPFQYTIESKKSVNPYGVAGYPLVCRNYSGTPALIMNEKLYRRIPLLGKFNKERPGSNLIRYAIPIAFVDDEMSVWHSTLKLETRHSVIGAWEPKQQKYVPDRNLTLSERCYCDPFKKVEKFVLDAVPLQSNSEIRAIIKKVNPYAAKFVDDNGVEPLHFAMIPYMETLAKAGYVFIDRFYTNSTRLTQSDADCLNRLCKYGTNPASIFKTSKAVYKVLGPYENDMQLWDTYRKLDKFGRISQDTILQSYEHAMSVKNLELINTILSQTYNGKHLFDWDTLYHYLVRLDKFEAISNDEALLLLKDYLNMCRQLGMRPRTDGDSLKREHDVAARLCRSMRNEKLADEMLPACRELEKYNYQEGVYFIRAIEGFDDLMSEATQQHSCLVSYGQDIAKRKSKIFVLREVSNPERSLITVELSNDRKSITQALTAYNKPIRNKSQHEFLHRWLAYVKDVDRYAS